jgi:hypothetical protein
MLGFRLRFLIAASTLVRHLVQQAVPSDAVVSRAPAHPVHGIPQFGQATLAIVCWFYDGLTSCTAGFLPVIHQLDSIIIHSLTFFGSMTDFNFSFCSI